MVLLYKDYFLLCRHIITKQTIIDINSIHQRFLRIFLLSNSVPNKLIISDAKVLQVKNSNNFSARIKPLDNLYDRNSDVSNILDNALADLEKYKFEKNPRMSTKIA